MKGCGFIVRVLRGMSSWAVLTALVLIPFFVFGEDVERAIDSFIAYASGNKAATALVLFTVLALDIVLPVPSCLLSAMCGAALGLFAGFAVSFLAMTVSALCGFALGRFCTSVGTKLVGSKARKLDNVMSRRRPVFLFLMRPVPVLAECSAVYAGLKGYPAKGSIMYMLMGNAVISAVYATIGMCGKANDSFVPSFVAVIVLSGAGALLTPFLGRRRGRHA